MKINPRYIDLGVFMALMLYGLALYFIPLHSSSFYFDDRAAIVNNKAITSIDIPKIFNAFNTRSLVGLSFALNYKWGGLHPFGYRSTNLLIHCLNAFLVYLLVRSTLTLYYSRRDPSPFGLGMTSPFEWPAFFASILFLCHPIQTEPVNSITQRFVLMGAFFYLLTFFLYIQYRTRSQKIYLFASLITALAAMFCKEFVVTLPLMLAVYDFYFLQEKAESWWKRCRRILPFLIIALIVPLLLLRTPHEAVGVANIADSTSAHHVDISRAKGAISRGEYFLTELNVVRTYVRLLFLPIHQNFDYDYPLSSNIDARTLLSAAFLLCLLAISVITYRSYRLISFCILWFFIALSVESSLIPIGHVIAEYRLYLSSVGFTLLVTTLIYTRQTDQKKLNIIAAVILIFFSVLTYQRNAVWKDEFTLWNDTVQKSPHKARGYNNRGLEYYRQGKFNEAMADFNKAIEINPDYAAAYSNRSVLYGFKGNLAEAMMGFNKAIAINPNYTDAYRNRAFTYYQLKEYNNALEDLDKAQKLGAVVDPQLLNALKQITGR